jgi:hypothetical protein
MVCAEAEKDGSRRGGAEGVIPSVYSLEHILKGSAPAAVICFLSLYSIVSHPIHPIWFVIPLAIWLVVASYKLYRLSAMGAWRRESLP